MNNETRMNAVSRAHRTMKNGKGLDDDEGRVGLAGLTMMAVAAAAQTTVTTSGGTTNTVPVFTGTSTVGNSPITVSGGNVGIGTTSPAQLLSVGSGSPFTVTSTGVLQAAGATFTGYLNVVGGAEISAGSGGR
jgi:organic hydroperoxide reductase OsmC/OhrA